jgi:hypothetical protein
MRRRTLAEWSTIADIAAAVAVVVSLLFVGLQVRDNTEALRSRNERALVDALESLELSRVTDAGFAELMLRAETGGALSDVDRSRVQALAYLYLDNWEQAFHDRQKGLIDADIWQALDDWLTARSRHAYFHAAVADAATSGTYSQDFAAHLRDILTSTDSRAAER